ncbi:MAG: cob(I)yrinic acid a,c-diamide adenosyltransferase [bacterium]
MEQKGLIQIYTGDGKGKTTAAVGLACRARAHNLRVSYIYFHKDPKKWKYGEHRSLEKLGIDIFGFAKKHPHFFKNINNEEIRKECLKGLKFIKKLFQENKYDILILDEILISLRDKLITEQELVELLNEKPKNLEVILTGRGATERIFAKADLVSKIENIKHPYNKGIKSRKGIEY